MNEPLNTESQDEPRPPQKTQQDQVEEKARQMAGRAASGGKEVHKAALAAWEGANSVAEKMLIIGGGLGIVSFFLPWFNASVYGVLSTNVSGLEFAKDGQATTWFFPVMMAFVLFLSWLNLHGDAKKHILNARWPILIGAAWSWFWAGYIASSHFENGVSAGMTYGGYMAAASSLLVLLAGIIQAQDYVRLVSDPHKPQDRLI